MIMSEERRWSDERLNELHAQFQEHCKAFEAHRDEVHEWITRDFVEHAKAEDVRMRAVSGAFPVGDTGEPDYYGHRRAHDAAIRAAEAQERFWRELRMEVAKKGAIAIIIVILGLLAAGLAIKTGIGAPSP